MSSKSTWTWVVLAALVFVFIVVFERYFRQPAPGVNYLLTDFNTNSVESIQIRRVGQADIRLERASGGWRLAEPVVYPAQSAAVQKLLDALQRLTVAHNISEQEFRSDTNADNDFGVDPPQLSLVLDSRPPIYFGRTTAPGDEVFVRIIGIGGVAVVDSSVLSDFPANADAWRETTLANAAWNSFDQVTVTNTSKSFFQFERNSSNQIWNMTQPMAARADARKVDEALQLIGGLRAERFVSDDPKADLDSFGLQPPALTIAFNKGTNTMLILDFGKELTNGSRLVYARRRDRSTVVAVSTNALLPWQASYEAFRDRHLVTLTGPIDKITVHGRDDFSLQWQTNNSWQVIPQNFPADTELAAALARNLSELQVANFEMDMVTEPSLPEYGLAAPYRKYVLWWGVSSTATNAPVELDFGTNSAGKIFARRVGEYAVYGIAPEDFGKLPDASWEMRERKIWHFDVNDVARIRIEQDGRKREIVRNGTNGWSLAAGQQGFINDSAVEGTTVELGNLSAFSWVGRGVQSLTNFGFGSGGQQLSIELKNGDQRQVQFGGLSRFGSPYAVVRLNDEPWIFEFPPDVYQYVRYSLSIPAAQ